MTHPGDSRWTDLDLHDPGLAVQRTRLAWRRTTLSTTVILLLAVSGVVSRGPTPLAVVAVSLLAVAWLAVFALVNRRIAVLDRGGPVTARRHPGALSALTVGLASLGLILTLILHRG